MSVLHALPVANHLAKQEVQSFVCCLRGTRASWRARTGRRGEGGGGWGDVVEAVGELSCCLQPCSRSVIFVQGIA